MRGEMFKALALLVALSGCSNAVGVDQCADPTKLRVKVADTIFDLPKTVGYIGGSQDAYDRGIQNLNQYDYASNPAYRQDCNSKEKRVADFGEEINFIYLGDGKEPKEYRQGDRMNAIVNISRYDPNSERLNRFEYLTKVENISKIRFVRRTPHVSSANAQTGAMSYEFAYQDRKIVMVCPMWDASKTAAPGNKVRPVFPLLCTPKMPFLANDILIGVNQRTTRFFADRPEELIPPEEWPKQWAYTINKILSYRIKSGEEAGQ